MTQSLEQWFNELVVRFKEEYAKLPKSKKQKFNFTTNLNHVCLIESLWVQNESMDSDLQFHLFFTKPGEKLEINCEKLNNTNYLETLNERLHEIHSRVYLSNEYNLKDSENEFFNNLLAIFLEGVQRFNNVKGAPKIVKKYLVSPNCFCWICTGRINEIKIEKIINNLFSNSKDGLNESPFSTIHYNGYGAFFYPPLWIGKHPKVSLEKGWSLKRLTKIVMGTEYNDKLIIIRNDGLVAVLEKDEKEALKILNDIMATAEFIGIPSLIVREPDLLKINAQVKYQRNGHKFSEANSAVIVLNDELYYTSPSIKEFPRIEINKKKIPELFYTLRAFSRDKNFKNFLIFYLESKSLFNTGSYSQSFFMSWLIIERYISLLWENIALKNLTSKRKKKLTNSITWSVSPQTETLNLLGIIDDEYYEKIMKLKKKRDDLIHYGKNCSKEDAEECLKLATFCFKKGIKPDNYSEIILRSLKKTLNKNNVDFERIIYDFGQVESVDKRDKGITFSFEEHLKALIYSMLSNHRRWVDIVDKLPQIDEIFFHFDPEKLEKCDTEKLINEIKNVKCGNVSIYRQIDALPHNVRQLKKIEKDFGSIDNFVTHDTPSKVIELLSKPKSKYKIKQIGDALALEYLKSVGIRGMKPDVHVNRICGPERLDIIPTKDTKKQLEEFKQFAESVNVSETYLDNLIWIFGADGFGEICTENPKCDKCELTNYCNYNN